MAYKIYKSYTFRRNLQRTLHYILSKHDHFHQDILNKKCNLLALAEITSSNFKDVRSDIAIYLWHSTTEGLTGIVLLCMISNTWLN